MSNVNPITGVTPKQNNQFKAGRDASNATVILKEPLKDLNVTWHQANVLVSLV